MIIDINVEKNNAHIRFCKPAINFPFVFSFFDRTAKIIIQANLNLDAFENFYKELKEKIDLAKLDNIIKEKK